MLGMVYNVHKEPLYVLCASSEIPYRSTHRIRVSHGIHCAHS